MSEQQPVYQRLTDKHQKLLLNISLEIARGGGMWGIAESGNSGCSGRNKSLLKGEVMLSRKDYIEVDKNYYAFSLIYLNNNQ